MKQQKNGKIIVFILVLLSVSILLLLGINFFLTDITSKPTAQIRSSCKIEEKYIEKRKVFIITPKEGIQNENVVLYFHGGSYVAEMSKKHWKFISDFVQDTKSTIILPDYPLTPKYNYEDVFAMVEPLYQKIIEKVDIEKLTIMGDSAGGGMSLALCEKIAQQQEKLPKQLILISPWLDVRMENEKIAEVQKKDKQLNKDALKVAGISYAGKEGINSFLVNPIEGPLEGLKNMKILIYTGTYDILNPDVHILEKRAREANIQIQIKEYEKQEHIWLLERGKEKTQEAQEAYEDLIKQIENL